jgi:homoserine kinase type II
MVVLTKLLSKDFEELLSNYNVGKYKKHKHIDFSLGNTNFILWTTKGKFIVKIFENKGISQVRYMLNIEEYLSKKKVKLPEIILTKKGKDIVKLGKKPVVICEFVKGKHVKRLTKSLLLDMGKNIGKMHQELMKFECGQRKNWVFANKLVPKKINSSFVKKEKVNLLEALKLLDYRKIRKSIIHGDLCYINYLVSGDRVKAFLDWDNVHKNYLVYDLAVLIAHTFMSYKRIKKDKIEIFMKHYQKYIKLNEEEKKALFLFIKIRLMGVVWWHETQRKNHPDQLKQIKKGIFVSIEEYKLLNEIGMEKFVELI